MLSSSLFCERVIQIYPYIVFSCMWNVLSCARQLYFLCRIILCLSSNHFLRDLLRAYGRSHAIKYRFFPICMFFIAHTSLTILGLLK